MQSKKNNIRHYTQGLLCHSFQLYQSLIFIMILIIAVVIPDISPFDRLLSRVVNFLAKIGYINVAFGFFPMFYNPFEKYRKDNITKLFNKHNISDVDKFNNEKKAS